jgi:hypothetical protein
LRTQLIRIQQNNFRHSTLAQAEQSGPSNRNINSDLCTTVATTRANTITTYVSRRGEQNVPKRYIKEAEWLDKEYGWGYYTTSNDSADDDTFIAVDFDFGALQWGVTRKLPDNGGFAIERPAPVKLGLRIYDEERVDRSRWGPLDGQEDEEEEQPRDEFKFGSDKETPQTKTSKSLPQTQQQQLKNNLHNWLATFPPTSPLPHSYLPLSTKHRHRLAQWPQSQQLPLSLQQLYWAELLDLQYPLTPLEADRLRQDLLEEEADIGQVEDLLWEEDHQDHQDLLEEGEIPEDMEEGEILEEASL